MISRRTTIISGLAASIFSTLISTEALASTRKARIIVSLADNANQGIVPIKASLGNGQDAKGNLYWGAMYGLKTFFKGQDGWTVQPQLTENPNIKERLLLYHEDYGAEIYAEAWDGATQKLAAESFMDAMNITNDKLTVFVGHNPLMDVNIPMPFIEPDRMANNIAFKRKFAVIACQSRRYFEERIKAAGHVPYVLTAGNMAPEAYVVEAIIRAWLENQPAETARRYAAEAYAKYQKIPIKNANWLFGV